MDPTTSGSGELTTTWGRSFSRPTSTPPRSTSGRRSASSSRPRGRTASTSRMCWTVWRSRNGPGPIRRGRGALPALAPDLGGGARPEEHPTPPCATTASGGSTSSPATTSGHGRSSSGPFPSRRRCSVPHHPALVRSLANLAIAEDRSAFPRSPLRARDRSRGRDDGSGSRRARAGSGRTTRATWGTPTSRKARQLLEQAQAVFSRALGPSHPQVLWVTSCLGDQAALVGDYAASERYFEQAIAGLERSPDAPPEFLVSALEGLASCQAETGRIAEARALYERALALGEKDLGPDHPRVAVILESLGDVLRRQGALGAAGSAYMRALRIRRKGFGGGRRDRGQPLRPR